MLEKLPRPLGEALRGSRAGLEKVLANAEETASVAPLMTLSSPAFEDGGPMPARFTADGEGRSPPLRWSGAPAGAASVVLMVEDPDAPSPQPLVHCIAWNLPGEGEVGEGALDRSVADGGAYDLGRNSFLKAEYLPPDPPKGHGPHAYVFQVYALDARLGLRGTPSRGEVLKAMAARMLAKGVLTGVYERR